MNNLSFFMKKFNSNNFSIAVDMVSIYNFLGRFGNTPGATVLVKNNFVDTTCEYIIKGLTTNENNELVTIVNGIIPVKELKYDNENDVYSASVEMSDGCIWALVFVPVTIEEKQYYYLVLEGEQDLYDDDLLCDCELIIIEKNRKIKEEV